MECVQTEKEVITSRAVGGLSSLIYMSNEVFWELWTFCMLDFLLAKQPPWSVKSLLVARIAEVAEGEGRRGDHERLLLRHLVRLI